MKQRVHDVRLSVPAKIACQLSKSFSSHEKVWKGHFYKKYENGFRNRFRATIRTSSQLLRISKRYSCELRLATNGYHDRTVESRQPTRPILGKSVSLLMSIEASRNHSRQSTPDGDAKRRRLALETGEAGVAAAADFITCSVDDMPEECLVRILGFLTEDDLASAAQVSHRLSENCRDPSLSQTRTAVVYCANKKCQQGVQWNSLRSLLETLVAMESTGKFARFSRVKLVSHALLDKLTIAHVRRFTRGVRLRNVSSLDFSVPYNSSSSVSFRAIIPKAMAVIMPNLREVDLSSTKYSQSAFRDFASKCSASLEKITWNHHSTSEFLSGQELRTCRNLKEFHANDSRFYSPDERHAGTLCSLQGKYCIFYHCNSKLERVSIKNAKYCNFSDKNKSICIPQSALLKFVRLTPNLRWFRSDLSPKNVSLLQVERPEITFF